MEKLLNFSGWINETEKVSENYEMNIDTGDSGEEHAKAVIDAAIEAHKETEEWNLAKALEKVMKDNDLNDDLDFKGMIMGSVKSILSELTKQAEAIK